VMRSTTRIRYDVRAHWTRAEREILAAGNARCRSR
jgi:hypothetical protein